VVTAGVRLRDHGCAGEQRQPIEFSFHIQFAFVFCFKF
jgi:hypothetical protein